MSSFDFNSDTGDLAALQKNHSINSLSNIKSSVKSIHFKCVTMGTLRARTHDNLEEIYFTWTHVEMLLLIIIQIEKNNH